MLLVLDQNASTYSTSSDDFTTRLDLVLEPDKYYDCALVRADLWYSWNNILTGVNDQIRYSTDAGATWKNIVIEKGIYSVVDLNNRIHQEMFANGDFTTNATTGALEYDIAIVPNYSTAKAIIVLSNNYAIDLGPNGSEFHKLLGFDNTQLILTDSSNPTYFTPNNRADISRGVNSVMIHVSCVGDSYLGEGSNDIIYSFSPTEPPQSGISLEPSQRVYLPIRETGGVVREIRVWLSDQQNRPLSLDGEPLTVVLDVRASSG